MQNLQSIQHTLSSLTPSGLLLEMVILGVCLAGAYAGVRLLRGSQRPEHSIWFGHQVFDGVLFPLLALVAGLGFRWSLKATAAGSLLNLAIPILTSLLLIRVSVQVLRLTFPASTLVRRLERTVSWLVWIGLVLWLSGLLPLFLGELDDVHWRIGGADITLLALLQGVLSALAVMLLVLWVSATIESRLLKGASGSDISARKIAANATRVLMLLVGLLVALSAAGIPMSALSVMGGAIGVGVGLGLQRLAANYVSGFVILAERSLRIGDLVKVDGFEGHITDIKSRYSVIRALSGRESIVPNELMITQRVENSSLADRNVLISTVLQVAYGTDLQALMPRMVAAAQAVPRVLAEPAVGVQLSAFADSGMELTLSFWICDPEDGQGNVRSAVNLALLETLNAAGVEIPYPQRVLRNMPAIAVVASAPGPAAPG
jgi:small-conductance mechanosensitive channel